MGLTDSLLHAAAKQKRKSEYLLYRECYAPLMSVTYRYFSNESDRMEALNESYFKILKNLNDFLEHHPSSQFMFWAKRITANTCIDLLRKQKRNLENPTEEVPVVGQVEQPIDNDIDVDELEAMMQKLPEVQRVVLNMHAVDGFTHKEISDHLGITIDNSRYHLMAARKSLLNWMSTAKMKFKSLVL